MIWRQDCYQLPTGRTSFGFKDGIGQPAVEGSGMPPARTRTSGRSRPASSSSATRTRRASCRRCRRPDVLGRNGTYVVFRKLHTRVAAYRQYLRAKAAEPRGGGAARREDGRALAERRAAGARPRRATIPSSAPTRSATTTSSTATIRAGFKCPAGAHARRANPRDALDDDGSVNVRLHRMIRRGTSYGPMLPEGVLEDDGADRGIIFVFAGAHLKRQFEFVKTQWLNDGIFIGAPAEKDPLVGPNDGTGSFTIPQRPIRRRLQDLPPFVVTRGGEYCFAPGLRALRWLAELDDVTRRRSTWQRPRQAPTAGRHSTSARRRPDEAEPDEPVLLDYDADGRVAVITLNRPHADNAITTEMGARLTEILETIAVRTAVRVAIITGAGERAFSVGSDLRQRKNMTKEDWLRQRQDFDRTLYTLRQLRKPIFAAVNGIAYGGGSEIAQSTDFIIASDNATFGQPEAMIGLAAGGGSPVFLPARPAAGQGAADADDRRPDHRARRPTGSAWSTSSTRRPS